jgi:GTPase SAR1 family protein
MELDEVVKEIQQNPTSLFYGAGVSIGSGGPNNIQLFKAIKAKFPNGESENFFEYLDQITEFDYSNRQSIEKFIKDNLAAISKQKEHEYLFSLPWRAVLTTNYDLIPDSIQNTMDERRYLVPIVDPDSQIDQTREDSLYCIKLLGDVNYNYPNNGWMVLSNKDLRYAFERYSKFFQLFRNLSSTGQIIYLGYSFNDNLVFELLQSMRYTLKTIPWKSYAITPNEPTVEIKKRMESFGITWVKGTLNEFIVSAQKIFGPTPISAPCIVNPFQVHKISLTLERATASNIWKKFRVFDSTLLNPKYRDPKKFFEGVDQSFYPYVSNYDFPRKTKIIHRNNLDPSLSDYNYENFFKHYQNLTSNISDNVLVCLTGNGGSGKTVIANRFAFNWYQNGNPVIFINPENMVIDSIALIDLLDEIWENYQSKVKNQKNIAPIRFLIIADDCGSLLEQLVDLNAQLKSLGKPADILLVVRKSDLPVERMKKTSINCIFDVDDTILPNQHNDFIKHFQKLNIVNGTEIISSNLRNQEINSSFFGLIYSSIHEVQKPIREIIKEEYQTLDQNSQLVYASVALLQSYSLTPYLSIILKSGNFESDWLDTQVKKGRLGGVIRFGSSKHELAANNRVIADIISDIAFPSLDHVHTLLRKIISTITSGDRTEMELLHLLLIDRIKKGIGRKLRNEQQIDLFKIAVHKIKSRPLLLHLAILQIDSDDFSQASITLEDALNSNVPGFPERDEHIIDQKGRLELHLAEKAVEEKREDEAWIHLKNAEENFNEAKINPGFTPHPYQGLGRVYLTQAKLSKDEKTRWAFLLLALEESNYIENYLGTGAFSDSLKNEIIDILGEDQFDESKIIRIENRIGKGNAYAFFAEREKRKSNPIKALSLVKDGLIHNPNSLWLIRLNVLLTEELYPDDSLAISAALDDYTRISDSVNKFDVVLGFELAKHTFKSGNFSYAQKLFNEIDNRTKRNPNRLKALKENRWIEKSIVKEFQGILRVPPHMAKYGMIECTSLSSVKIQVRSQDIEFQYPRGGERVAFNIIFRMVGPQASRVRKISL